MSERNIESQWRPFEPSRDECARALIEGYIDSGVVKIPRSCNRHVDCDEADARARMGGRSSASHCHKVVMS